MQHLHSLEDIINKLKEMQPIECTKGIDYPCITCLECPNANYEEFSLNNNIRLRWTTNSAILSIRIPLRDYLDEMLYRELYKEMARKIRFFMETPEEGFQISLFIRDKDVADSNTLKRIEAFILKDLKEIAAIITHGRVMIKDWARYFVEKMECAKTV